MWHGEPMTDAEIITTLDENGIDWYRNKYDDMNIYATPDPEYDDSDCVSGMTLEELFAWIRRAV